MRLSDEQVQQYLDDGFLVVEDVFTRQELQPVLDDFEVMVDGWADKLYAGGKIADKHEGEDVYTRLASLEKEWPNAAALVHWREGMRPTLSKIWASDNLLDMVEQFIGPDIVGHPVSVIRTKTPDTALMTVPWHQDSAYFLEGGEDTFQPTAWIPFVDATAENGTLQVFRGSHKLGRVLPHHFEKDIGHQKSWYLYIKDEDLPDAEIVTCEMKKSSVLWHRNTMIHRSTENHSDKVRWSVDLRYQRPGEPTGFPEDSELPPMRKSDDPAYRLDWEAWIAARQGEQDVISRGFNRGFDKYKMMEDEGFDFSPPDAPWLLRWQKGEPTGFPEACRRCANRTIPPMSYRLDWEAWIAARQGEQDVISRGFNRGFDKYKMMEDEGFDFSPPDAPWLLRWQKYWDEVA